MPRYGACMANALFPSTLSRKHYVIRWLVMFAVVLASMMFFVAAPMGAAAQIAGLLFGLVVLFAFLYNIFGLSIPRLKNAQISLLALLLVFIPFGVLILFGVCAIAREKA